LHKAVPQRLKPNPLASVFGEAEAVPFRIRGH
jgi:hypothetical protein